MDGTGIHESINWWVHKWKKTLARAILSSLMGRCCDGSHKQECRKTEGFFLPSEATSSKCFPKHSSRSAAGIAQNHFSSFNPARGLSAPTLGSPPPSTLSVLCLALTSDQHPGLCFLLGRNDASALTRATGKMHMPIVISNGHFTLVYFPLLFS